MVPVVSDRRAVWCFVGLVLFAAGCASQPRGGGTGLPRGTLVGTATPDQLQSAVMSFADRYVLAVADASIMVAAGGPTAEVRMAAMRNKMATALAAYTIAAEANPIVSVLDMTTMVTLKRMVWEEFWMHQYDGPGVEQLKTVYQQGEDDIWDVARQLLTDEQEKELHELIVEWREKHPDQRTVSYVRLKDFDIDRNQPMEVESKSRTSIFQLLYIDPLAGLDPSTREMAQLRRMLERQAYFAQRIPLMASLFVPQLMADVGAAPEVQQLLTYLGEFTGATESFTANLGKEGRAIVDQLNTNMTALEESATKNVGDILATEREALITGLDDALTQQREAIMAGLDAQEESATELIKQADKALESAKELAASVKEVIDSTAKLTAKPEDDGPADPDAHPFDVREYEAAAAKLSEAAQNITALLDTLDVTLSTPARTPVTDTALGQVMSDFESSMSRSIDRAFVRLLVLAGIVIVSVVGIKVAGGRIARAK